MKKIFKLIKVLLVLIILSAVAVCGTITVNGYQLYQEVITQVSLEDKIEQIQSSEDYITLDDIPKDFQDAIIAIEDHRFYSHFGIDLIALGRAVITNVTNGEIIGGGSTITQQLAKNMYFTQEKKFTRKVAEAFVAFDLERNYEKEEILELYLNISYFGDGFYGINAAANGYFNKEPMELTLDECTLLAGLINAPSVYALSNQTILSYQRQEQVIDAMVKYDYLSLEEANTLKESLPTSVK